MTIKSHFTRYAILVFLAAALVGCSSTKLNQPPPAGTSSGAGIGTQGSQSAVSPVQARGANGDDLGGPPAAVGRVVYFDFDSFSIKPDYQSVIEQQGRYLQSHPNSHVTLEGSTDERGSREYNLALGQKRAEAVQRALTLVGASGSQIESVSFGSEKPADPGHDEAAYAKNRRVEFHYHQ